RHVAYERCRRGELRRREGGLRGEAGVLDPHREMVTLYAVQPAVVAPVQRAVVLRCDVPRPVALAHELRDLGAILVHDVMHARLRDGIHEPAPAARVVALARMDDHDVERSGRVARPLVEIGRRAPYRRRVVRGAGISRRRAGGRPGGPGNSSAPRTICQRVSTHPNASSSADGTWNSAPAAANTESNGEGRATGAACSPATPATRGEGQGSTGASRQAATRTMSAAARAALPSRGLSRAVMGGAVCPRPTAPAAWSPTPGRARPPRLPIPTPPVPRSRTRASCP